jgi:cell wall-associated NlpC family hydrolase
VTIPRTSEEQWANLPHVSRPAPGDLIFYTGSPIDPPPGHVVMYIGHGEVIQAYATGTPVERTPLSKMAAGQLIGYARP